MPISRDEQVMWYTRFSIRNQAIREFLAEILGTFVLVIFAVGGGCQTILSGPNASSTTNALTSGFAVMFGIYIAGGVSGGGVNPAVSLSFCLTNRTPWRMYPVHVIGQLIGSFLASGLMFAVYRDAIHAYDDGHRSVLGPTGSAPMFTSFPKTFLSTQSGFLDQVVGTGMMMVLVNAILDNRNMDVPKGIAPFLVGLSVMTIGGTLGLNCGYPLNPARDLGPRLFLLAAGWDREVFSYRDYNWFWVPIAGPLTGSAVGTFLYYAFVGWHWTTPPHDKAHDNAMIRNSTIINHHGNTANYDVTNHVSNDVGKMGVVNVAYAKSDSSTHSTTNF